MSVGVSRGGVTAVDTIASYNSGAGFFINFDGTLLLAHSTAIGNGTGVQSGGSAISFGDNHIHGNGTDVNGTLTNVGTR